MKDINRPNDTAQELDKLREDSLKQAIKNSRKFPGSDEPDETPPADDTSSSDDNDTEIKTDDKEKTDNTKKSDKKLDNDDKDSYIDDNEFERVLNDTFDGDGTKAVKSWKESQKAYTKLYNEANELKQNTQQFQKFLQENPALVKLIKRAEEGEDIESLIRESAEPEKANPTNDSSNDSKLDVPNDADVTDEELIEKGFVNKEFLEDLSEDERRSVLRRAKIKYLESELPKRIAQKGAEEYRKQIDEIKQREKQEREEEETNKTISQRYDDGIDTIVKRFDLDFANNDEHRSLLNEINGFVANIRDPQNPNLIHENAVELATEHILKSKGMLSDLDKGKVDTSKPKKDEEVPDGGFNANRRTPPERKATSISEKLDKRHRESYEKYQEMNPAKRSQQLNNN